MFFAQTIGLSPVIQDVPVVFHSPRRLAQAGAPAGFPSLSPIFSTPRGGGFPVPCRSKPIPACLEVPFPCDSGDPASTAIPANRRDSWASVRAGMWQLCSPPPGLPRRRLPRVSSKISRETGYALAGRDPTKRFLRGAQESCRWGWIPEAAMVAIVFIGGADRVGLGSVGQHRTACRLLLHRHRWRCAAPDTGGMAGSLCRPRRRRRLGDKQR